MRKVDGNPKEIYESIFDSVEAKAIAFDKVAEKYYFRNFGTMPKSELDIFMFSIFLEQILEKSEDDISAYSDYRLSKILGLTQSRVASLKEKKQSKYPYEKFDWKESFLKILKNARYEKGNVLINIPEKNLYIEVKEAIESQGGYIDVQLNTKLMKIPLEYFVDLMLIVQNEEDRKKQIESIKDWLKNKDIDVQNFESNLVGEIIKSSFEDGTEKIICELIRTLIPFGGVVSEILNSLYCQIYKNKK